MSGIGVGQCPRRQNFALEIPTCWYILALPNAKICVTPTPNLNFALPPTPAPDASQWNIGGIGSLALGLCVGHVHFIFFVLISFASGTQCKLVFQWNMGNIMSNALIAISQSGNCCIHVGHLPLGKSQKVIVACHMSEKGPRCFRRGKSNLKTVLESL